MLFVESGKTPLSIIDQFVPDGNPVCANAFAWLSRVKARFGSLAEAASTGAEPRMSVHPETAPGSEQGDHGRGSPPFSGGEGE